MRSARMKANDPRARPRQDRSRFTVAAILDATERILGRAERVTTRSIARVAGVSVGTLYQYFPAKEAAIAQVIDRRLADDERRMLAVFERMRSMPLADALHAATDSFVPRSEWERALYPQLVDTLESVARLDAVQELLGRFEHLLAEEFSRRRDELAEGVDPKIAATVLLYALRAALFALSRSHPELPREQVVYELCRLGMNYLQGAAAADPGGGNARSTS